MAEEKIKTTLNVGNKVVSLVYDNFDEAIDLDTITRISYENLYGDAVTVSTIMNKFGILRAETQEILSVKKLDLDVYSAEVKKAYRREAVINGGKVEIDGENIKLTEKGIDDLLILDEEYQEKKRLVISAQKDFEIVDSLSWAIASKDKKLSVLVKGVTPEEFSKELTDGKINGVMIKKRKSIVD